MKVFLTGATGYVGRQVVRDLLNAGHSALALVRKGSESKLPEGIASRITMVIGDALKPESVPRGAPIVRGGHKPARTSPRISAEGDYIRGIHFLGTKYLVDEAQTAGALRFVQMSALGVRLGTAVRYQETKYRAEEYVKASRLRWTIFRPSLMFGNEMEGVPNFISVLRDLLTIAPFFVPVLGGGKYRFQPVSVQNVSEGFVKALTNETSVGKIYDVAGPDQYSYNELLDMVAYVIGIHKIKIHQPMIVMKIMASLLGRFSFFPVSRDQITMLEEENISARWKEFFDDLAITPMRAVENIHKGF